MGEKKNEKVKGFRLSDEEIQILNELIASTGRDPQNESSDWLRDMIHKLKTQELVLEEDGITPSLRKHFASDVSSLKDATTSITNIFINQMNRIAVEKNNWDNEFQKTKLSFEEQLKQKQEKIKELENTIISLEQDIDSANNHTIQLQNKIDGFDKLEEQLRKDIVRFETDKTKHEEELQRLREELLSEKERYQKDIEEIKQGNKDEKDKLNQQIVDLVKELQETEPISRENETLRDQIRALQETIRNDNRKYEIDLTRQQEQAEIEKEKALLTRERQLRDEFHNQNRMDTKELYEKVERLQEEIQALRIENNQLKGKGI